MNYTNKLTREIAENAGKIVFGKDYKLDDLCFYPNGFRITHRPNFAKTKYLHVEYEGYRAYLNDFEELKGWEQVRLFAYLQKEMGIEVYLPDYISKK